jgi:hypothetical protein
VQLAIALVTASLDSPELHLVNLLLLHQLYEATRQPPVTTLQKLAIMAAAGPQTPFTG